MTTHTLKVEPPKFPRDRYLTIEEMVAYADLCLISMRANLAYAQVLVLEAKARTAAHRPVSQRRQWCIKCYKSFPCPTIRTATENLGDTL